VSGLARALGCQVQKAAGAPGARGILLGEMSRPLFTLALSALSFGMGCSSSSPAAEGADATADEASGTMPDVYVAQPAPCTTSNDQPVQASDFDQSCTVNAECAAVGEGNACDPCTAGCYNAAINFQAVPQYLARFPKMPAGSPSTMCSCPPSFFACCRNGACHADLQCQIDLAEAGAAAGTGDAAADDGASDGGIDAAPDVSALVEGGPVDAGGD
jgi:hypothetical protein